jgi:hypothetical protein
LAPAGFHGVTPAATGGTLILRLTELHTQLGYNALPL